MLLRDFKIGKKLLLINLISASFTMTLLILSIAIIALITNRNNLIQDLKIQSRILGESLSASIAFNDAQSAQHLLEALRWSPYIQKVVVLNREGQTFSSYPLQVKIDLNQKLTFWNSLSNVVIQQPIGVSNQQVGQIYIVASLHHIYIQLGKFLLLIFFGMILAGALGVYMIRRLQINLTKPIIGLTDSMRQVSNTDDYSLRFNLDSKDELGELASGFNTMLGKIESHQAKLDSELLRRKHAEDRLQQLAFYDEVTKLPNRHYFKERMEGAVASSIRYKKLCCIMVIDLDDFKIVNDTLGHNVSDDLLLAVAKRLSNVIRTSDVLCRIGGDEFALVLENILIAEEAIQVAKKIINTLSQPFVLEGREVFIGASIGVSLCPTDTADIPILLRNADTAMYSAKNQGKNSYQMYQPEMESKNILRFSLESALRRALENNELLLHYQPQVDLISNQTTGFEALVRWNNAELGLISPTDFIPIAEEIGLIIPIGEFVLYTACLQAQQWRERHAVDINISVNLSGRQLIQANIVERILAIVESTGLPFNLLTIELTESILMDHSKETLDKLEKLSQSGFTISIDDFGTGYSSMSYLKRYPIDTLKIDRSFVSGLPEDANDVAITQAIIALAKNLDMKLVAEGVETEEQLEFLRVHKCDTAQGYLHSRPVVAEQAEQFILNKNDRNVVMNNE
ncbi:EAL domain-containing protein [Methylotenera versatilis]|uniref:Diguanylate cyclase/phosphodiesterase with extracellular sensor n=1 Tax=Methylotenera versatilis (strain 301) TaxID=666681 RepID=D7DM83_METV0|nr:EAL domain-containing protein [Methylotenera versatilis]ADI28794.1 diguanylate cyclase/phosphodiesterase with extracellular sensor [Methylotenera versatilis 301]